MSTKGISFSTHLREALHNLLSSKMRSFLAILGILVGTGSVVALISSSQMATAHALKQFKSLGTNLLALSIQSNDMGGNSQANKRQFTLKDVPAVFSASDKIDLVAPYISVYSSIYFNGKNIQGQVVGMTHDLLPVVKMHIGSGRFVSYLDNHSYFCLVGDKIAKQLRQHGVFNPIGKQIQLGKVLFTIVGVLGPWQTNLFMFADLNDSIMIPLQTAYLLSKYANINDLLIRVKKGANLKTIQTKVDSKLKLLLPKKQFQFRSPDQIIGIMTKQRSTFTYLLGMIGSISLLVGGIGVMNIMLVSVIERRREIGIRLAIGARRGDIRYMFLIESITLTLFGGLMGVILGVTISVILALAAGWGFTFFILPPVLGFVVSVIVGMISGFYPAFRASKLDPIETLHGD